MMLKKYLVIVFALLFVCQFVIAEETEITINTLVNHSVNINFLNPESTGIGDLMFDTETMLTGETGEISYTFVNDADVFDLSVFVMDGSTKILYERFEKLKAEDDITLILFPGVPKESMIELSSEKVVANENEVGESNETAELNEINNSEITNKTKFSLNSFFGKLFNSNNSSNSSEEKKSSNPVSKSFFYILIFFILFGIIFFGLKKYKQSKVTPKRNYNGRKAFKPFIRYTYVKPA